MKSPRIVAFPGDSLLLIIGLLAHFLLPAQGLYFYIDGNTPKCVYEELPKDTLVVGELYFYRLAEKLILNILSDRTLQGRRVYHREQEIRITRCGPHIHLR